MTKNEVVLFKQYDSDISISGRTCFHTAFKDPNAKNAPPRESIEVRCLLLFPDHTPNTCPDITKIEDVGVNYKLVGYSVNKIEGLLN